MHNRRIERLVSGTLRAASKGYLANTAHRSDNAMVLRSSPSVFNADGNENTDNACFARLRKACPQDVRGFGKTRWRTMRQDTAYGGSNVSF